MKSLSIILFLFIIVSCQEFITADLVRIEGNWKKSSTIDICPSSVVVASNSVYFGDLDVDGQIDEYTEDAETKFTTNCTIVITDNSHHNVREYNLNTLSNSTDFIRFIQDFYADYYRTSKLNISAEILTFSEYKINYLLSVTRGHRLAPFTENITLTK